MSGGGSFNGSVNGDSEKWTRIKDVRNIRELFKGRLTDGEAKRLYDHFERDRDRTVAHILDCGPGELNALLGTLVRPENPNINVEDRTNIVTRDNVLKDLARRNEIGNSCRQYTCEGCDQMWWRRVPNRKLVSRCFRCKRKYDPIPRDEEWGWGEFECQCGRTFAGWARMGKITSQCNDCGHMCAPTGIIPAYKKVGCGDGGMGRGGVGGNRRGGVGGMGRGMGRGGNRGVGRGGIGEIGRGGGDGVVYIGRGTGRGRRLRQDKHSCSAQNCFQRRGVGDPDQECMHPESRPKKVQVPSPRHVSTGSTVNTFLPQDDIEPPYQPSEASISED